jgi:hypothetical protein
MPRRNKARITRSKTSSPQPPEPSRGIAVACLTALCVLFVASEVFTYTRQSATWDEPGHLLAGYAALTRGDYRVDIEHPPLLRAWLALPLLTMRVNDGALDQIEHTNPETLAFQGPFDLGHRFLYLDNDADRLLYRARFMTVLLGAGLGCLVFCWAYEWLGPRGAILAILLYVTEPNIAAHSALATSDLGVSCFIFATVYFLWRSARSLNALNLSLLAVSFVFALLSKFSALVLLPIAVVLLVFVVARGRLTVRAAGAVVLLLLAAGFVGSWTGYGFQFAQARTPGWSFALHNNSAALNSVPMTAALVGWLDANHVLPSALVQGFLHGQGLATGRPAFLMGDYSLTGWWYYFPAAFLLKTSLTLLVLLALHLVLRTWRAAGNRVSILAFVVLPIVIYMSIAMASALNIGLRHILPVYPFVILIAAQTADALVSKAGKRALVVAAAIAVAAVVEFGTTYPHPLAFFNALAGGPHNGFRYLADSNVDWGQDLKPLKRWMEQNRVDRMGLAYFGTADPAYYGMNVRYLWGTTVPGVKPEDMGPPSLPGYVAVSVTLLDGVPFQEGARDFYRPLRDSEPVADIGGSIRVYRVNSPWW